MEALIIEEVPNVVHQAWIKYSSRRMRNVPYEKKINVNVMVLFVQTELVIHADV